MMLPLVVAEVAHQQSKVREATTASGVDNAASLDWQGDTAERDYFTSERG